MMEREEVLDLIYAANTPTEIKQAREARAAYLREHPDDEEIVEIGEMLSILETTWKETETPVAERVA